MCGSSAVRRHHECWSCSGKVPNERDAALPMALAGLEEVYDDNALDGRVDEMDGGSEAYIDDGGCACDEG